jgi:hypothetical protein
LDLTSVAGANAALTQTENATNALSQERVVVGSNQNQLNRINDFNLTRASNQKSAADSIRVNELGTFGSLFGKDLAGVVNELLGFDF